MAALSTIGTVVTAAAAVGGAVNSYQQGKRASRAADEAATRSTIEAQGAMQADALAAANAQTLAAAQETARRNEELAAQQIKETPDVATGDVTAQPNRLRRVRASFNLDANGGAGGTGALRV